MKRVLAIVLTLALGAGLVGAFAEGQSEDPDTTFGRGWRYDDGPVLEEVTLTGRVYFEDMDFPVLKTSDGDYELMVPRYYTYDFEIEEGQTVTVEGFLGPEEMPMGRFSRADEDELHIMVTKAIVGGEEFEFTDGSGGMMMSRDFDPRSSRRGGPMSRTSKNAPRGGRW